MIKKKEKEYYIIIMAINMKVILKMIKKKGKEYIIIIMEQKKKENGKMINYWKKVFLIFGNYKYSELILINLYFL